MRVTDGLVDLTRRRGWRGWLIVGFVAVQLVAPLHYYAAREDKNDERFAWRMFSSTRMLRCDPRFEVDGRLVDRGRTFHEAWWEIARRGRVAVLEEMGRHLCRRNPGKEVRLDLTCKTVDGKEVRRGGADLCVFPEL
jgi:hypothetical protein